MPTADLVDYIDDAALARPLICLDLEYIIIGHLDIIKHRIIHLTVLLDWLLSFFSPFSCCYFCWGFWELGSRSDNLLYLAGKSDRLGRLCRRCLSWNASLVVSTFDFRLVLDVIEQAMIGRLPRQLDHLWPELAHLSVDQWLDSVHGL